MLTDGKKWVSTLTSGLIEATDDQCFTGFYEELFLFILIVLGWHTSVYKIEKQNAVYQCKSIVRQWRRLPFGTDAYYSDNIQN